MPAVNPDGTPGNVAADELIESAWGNAVADTITDINTELGLHDNRLTNIETRENNQVWRSGRQAITTDASGDGVIFFGYTFAAPASDIIVVCTLTDAAVGGWVAVTSVAVDRNACYVKLWNHTGANPAGVLINVNWHATGPAGS